MWAERSGKICIKGRPKWSHLKGDLDQDGKGREGVLPRVRLAFDKKRKTMPQLRTCVREQ